MKEYIKNNWNPLVVGFAVAMIYNVLLKLIESIILKIALIIAG
jgi:inner membrane protein involved in colicin E2 resistance